MVYHVLNRGVGRRTLFHKDQDFLAFERVVEETLRTCAMRICAFCTLSNHWHFVLWPESDGDLPAFMQQMTNMHVKRWQEYRWEIGYGHLYQGRYKCFPVETEDYFYQVVRYVERNALRANLVACAEQWPWSSLRRGERDDPAFPILSPWPLPRGGELVGNRELRAVRGGVGRLTSLRPPRLSLGECRLGRQDREAVGNRVDVTGAGEAKEGTGRAQVTVRLPKLPKHPKFGGWHLFCSYPGILSQDGQ